MRVRHLEVKMMDEVELEAQVDMELVTEDPIGCITSHQSANYVTRNTTWENAFITQMPLQRDQNWKNVINAQIVVEFNMMMNAD